MSNLRGWKMRVYRALFNAAQSYWINERWIRVTDNQGEPQFVQINKPVVDPMTMQPQIQNAIGELDVDIILDEGPDTVTVMQDTYEAISQALPSVSPDAVAGQGHGGDGHTDRDLAAAGGCQETLPRHQGAGRPSRPRCRRRWPSCRWSSRTRRRSCQMDGARMQQEAALKREIAALEAQVEQQKAAAQMQIEREKAANQMQIEQYKVQQQTQLQREKTEAEIVTGSMHEIDRQTTEFRNGLISEGQASHRSGQQQMQEMLEAMHAMIGQTNENMRQSHAALLAMINKPRKAVIHRDPVTNRVVGASSVSGD